MSTAVLSPTLTLLSEDRVRNLEVRRPVTGMATVQATHSDRPDFVPADMLQWVSHIEGTRGVREESCTILWPESRCLGSFARWDSSHPAGRVVMPAWVADASMELRRALADGDLPNGEVKAGIELSRRYFVGGAQVQSFSNGESFPAGYLSITWSGSTTGQSSDRYRIGLNAAAGSNGSAIWTGTRGHGYELDVPAWVRDASEALLEEMENAR